MYGCEDDLQQTLDCWTKNPDKWTMGDYTVDVPLYVVEDAIQRLRRYEQIVQNLTNVGLLLWKENLRKYGERKIHDKESPSGVYQQETFQRMCSFVNELPEKIDLEDGFVELALQLARFDSGDPTGLTQYIDKEDDLFERLESGEIENG